MQNRVRTVSSAANRFLIIFNKQSFTHKHYPSTFQEVLGFSYAAFGAQNLPSKFQFYYSDEEGDIISISSQEDYEEAIETEPKSLTLIIAQSASQAKFLIPINQQEKAMRGEMSVSVFFEDVRPGSTVIMQKESFSSQQTWNYFNKEPSVNSEAINSQHPVSQFATNMLSNRDPVRFPCIHCEGMGRVEGSFEDGICCRCNGSGFASERFTQEIKQSLKQLIREILVEQEVMPSYNPVPSSLLTYQVENQVEEQQCQKLGESENIFKLIGNSEQKNEPEAEDEAKEEVKEALSINKEQSEVKVSVLEQIPEVEEQILVENQEQPVLEEKEGEKEEEKEAVQEEEDEGIFKKEQSSIALSELREEDKQLIAYQEAIVKANIQDPAVLESLQQLVGMGYLNFEVNMGLIKKYKNNLYVVVDKLLAESVSASSFQ